MWRIILKLGIFFFCQVILISSLSSIPTYFMCLFIVPSVVAKKLGNHKGISNG